MISLAKSCSRLDQRVEHRLQIECRAANDLEHVGGGGLLLERFGFGAVLGGAAALAAIAATTFRLLLGAQGR